jgi:hypothetical protein
MEQRQKNTLSRVLTWLLRVIVEALVNATIDKIMRSLGSP